jgi:hypothetical protein
MTHKEDTMTATPRQGYWKFASDGMLPSFRPTHTFDWVHAQDYQEAVNVRDRAVKVLKDMHRYLSAGPIKLKSDIEHCQNLIESALTDMEG